MAEVRARVGIGTGGLGGAVRGSTVGPRSTAYFGRWGEALQF